MYRGGAIVVGIDRLRVARVAGEGNQRGAIYLVSIDTMLKQELQQPLLHCAKAMRLVTSR